MSADAERVEQEEEGAAQIAITAPEFPWEIVVKNSATFFQRLPDGGMMLKFVPGSRSTGMMAPAVSIIFSSEAWEHHQGEVAAGEKKQRIQTATVLPPGVARV